MRSRMVVNKNLTALGFTIHSGPCHAAVNMYLSNEHLARTFSAQARLQMLLFGKNMQSVVAISLDPSLQVLHLLELPIKMQLLVSPKNICVLCDFSVSI